jgi:hypothetical protein
LKSTPFFLAIICTTAIYTKTVPPIRKKNHLHTSRTPYHLRSIFTSQKASSHLKKPKTAPQNSRNHHIDSKEAPAQKQRQNNIAARLTQTASYQKLRR